VDLIADIGNTRAHLALFEGERLLSRTDVPHADPPAERQRAYAAFAEGHPAPGRFAIGSVNRRGRGTLEDWVRARFGLDPWILRQNLPDPLPLDVDAPEQVGPDRIANAFWAARTYPGRAVVVIDMGTAITFDVVSSQGVFVGGVIAAGLGTQSRALAHGTDRLPEVGLEPGAPPTALGRTTAQCLAGGLFFGAVGLVEATCASIARELGEAPTVVATGGDAPLIAPHCPIVSAVEPEATLRGIHLALEALECA
jgi:type III pantothenate kinase